MSWWNPFKKKEEGELAGSQALPADQKGLASLFYRKWKDPAFLKQLRTLAAHMARDGVNVKDINAVKAWLEKNKGEIEAGKFNEPPSEAAKPATYVKTGPDIGRNDPCPCGSGKKYKKCHGAAA